MPFLRPLQYEDLSNEPGKCFGRPKLKLLRSLSYFVDGCGLANVAVHVPKDFVTDLASVPRILWLFISPWGKTNRSAVTHDYLCQQPGFPRFLADAIFRTAMKDDKVPVWQRVVMYYSVRFWSVLSGKG